MTRTNLHPVHGPHAYSTGGQAVTLDAADVSGGNQFPSSGNDLIVAYNSDSSPHTITIHSAADPFGRTGDVTAQTLAAGELRVFGPLPATGWMQSNGKINVDASDATVKVGIVAL